MTQSILSLGAMDKSVTAPDLVLIWLAVGAFCHILICLIIPLSFFYIAEVWARLGFLHLKRPGYSQARLLQLFWCSVGCTAHVFILATQIVWILLNEFWS